MIPKRIKISWGRALELLKQSDPDLVLDILDIKGEKDLNDFFGYGRRSTSVSKYSLSTDEVIKLDNLGIDWEDDNRVCLNVQKETSPGKYMIGEF